MAKKQRRKNGDIVEIVVDNKKYFARVLENPLFAFYDIQVELDVLVLCEDIIMKPVLFKIDVMKYAITGGRWKVIGNLPLSDDLLEPPVFFRQDALNDELFLYYADGTEAPASFEQCAELECAAVWDPQHVEDRLVDHYHGRPNCWYESARPKAPKAPN